MQDINYRVVTVVLMIVIVIITLLTVWSYMMNMKHAPVLLRQDTAATAAITEELKLSSIYFTKTVEGIPPVRRQTSDAAKTRDGTEEQVTDVSDGIDMTDGTDGQVTDGEGPVTDDDDDMEDQYINLYDADYNTAFITFALTTNKPTVVILCVGETGSDPKDWNVLFGGEIKPGETGNSFGYTSGTAVFRNRSFWLAASNDALITFTAIGYVAKVQS